MRCWYGRPWHGYSPSRQFHGHVSAVSENHDSRGTVTINDGICMARFRGERKPRQSRCSNHKSRHLHGTLPRKRKQRYSRNRRIHHQPWFKRGKITEDRPDLIAHRVEHFHFLSFYARRFSSDLAINNSHSRTLRYVFSRKKSRYDQAFALGRIRPRIIMGSYSPISTYVRLICSDSIVVLTYVCDKTASSATSRHSLSWEIKYTSPPSCFPFVCVSLGGI